MTWVFTEAPEIGSFYRDIEDTEIKIAVEEDRLKQLRRDLTEAVLASPPLGKNMLDCLYWYTKVPVEALRANVGARTVSQFIDRWISPHTTEVTCAQCGVELEARTRAKLKELDSLSRRGVSTECGPCTKGRHSESHSAWNQRIAELEQRRQALRTMPYSDYLQTPEWKEKRVAALKRARFACEVCNAKALLDVHHRTYENRGNEYASDLTVLCRSCHSKFHDKLPAEPMATR